MDFEWKKEWTAPSAVGAVTFVVGVGVGYGIRSYLNWRLVKDLKDRINEVAEDLDAIMEEDPQLEIEWEKPVIVETYDFSDSEVYTDEDLGVRLMEESVMEEKSNVTSVFPETDDDWDYAEETANRNPGEPYIIHKDEFDDNENDFTQTTITYYRGDDVLCDEADVPIYNPAQVVGELKFGHGSQDPNVVYVRNEKNHAEYEVLLDNGHYTVEVLGQEYADSFENQKAPLTKFREE